MFVREKISPLLWDTAVNWVLALPGFAVFAGLALFLYAIGYRRERTVARYAAG
jgi:hypothetical protein